MQQDHSLLLIHVEKTRAIRLPGSSVRTSCSPSPMGRLVGIPTGQPNSTVWISCPIRRRSSAAIDLSQARTGSLPASVRKKHSGNALLAFHR